MADGAIEQRLLNSSRATIPGMSKTHWGYGGVYQRGGTWWIHYPVNGKTVRESSKSAKKSDAEKLLKLKLAEVNSPRFAGVIPQQVTVGALLDDLVRDYRLNKKRADWAEIVVRHLKKHFEYQKAGSMPSRIIDTYIDKRKAEGRANGTINRELAILRRAFVLGSQSDPPKVIRVPRIEELSENGSVREGFFEHPEYLAMLGALPEEIQPVITFAYFTGCRKAEILSLKWEQVDLNRGMVRLKGVDTKSKHPRILPLTKQLREVIGRLAAQRSESWPWSRWVFSRDGEQIRTFRGAWDKACESSGVHRLFHDLRRTGVRNLIRAGVPEKIAMQISGHRTRSVFERYHIVSEDDLQDAATKLERYIGEK